MGRKTEISWTEHTWNPWMGCRKVSAGCKYCYMFRDMDRFKMNPAAITKSKTGFNFPLKLEKGKKHLVFTCSWSDWFIEEADEWRDEAWKIIKDTPHVMYQILTKRPERIRGCLPEDWGEGYPNVMLGVSIENQGVAYERMALLQSVPAKCRFISAEPLIGPVSFLKAYGLEEINTKNKRIPWDGIDWVIIGGESGNDSGLYRYRKCNPEWVHNLASEAIMYGVTPFIKQLGTHTAKEIGLSDRHGKDPSEWPSIFQDLQIFPKFIKDHMGSDPDNWI